MKRMLRSSLKSSNINKEQIINSNPLKKQRLMITKTSVSSPQYTPQTPENTFSDILTVDTPRSDDTNTLLSDTSDSDTITEEDDVLDKEIAIKDQFINRREQETKEIGNKIFNGQVKLIREEKENPIKLAVNGQDEVHGEKKETVDSNKIVKSKDIRKHIEVKKDESKLLQSIVVDTEDKSLSISLDTSEIKCHSFTVKSNVQIVKISPKSAIYPISFRSKKVRIIIYHQGRLIDQNNHFNNPCSILLRNGLNCVEIWVKDDFLNHDDIINEDSEPGQKYLLFIRKL